MFNLRHLLAELSLIGWGILIVGIIAWVFLTYFSGRFSEKKWGDRESGALIGFFTPMMILIIYSQWVYE